MNGVLKLVLEGEDPERVAGAVAQKRIEEYYKLRWRQMGGRPRRGLTDRSTLETA